MIRDDLIRYDSAYYTHENTSSSKNLKIKSLKVNCGTLIKTLLNSLKHRKLTKLTFLNINDTNGGKLLLTANPVKY